MMTNFRTILLFVLASLMIQSVNGQSGALSADSQISLLTCEPGHFIHSTFGHSALRIKGQIDGHDIDSVYNFGTFEFTDDFALKFARGKLNYMLSKDHYGQFLNM